MNSELLELLAKTALRADRAEKRADAAEREAKGLREQAEYWSLIAHLFALKQGCEGHPCNVLESSVPRAPGYPLWRPEYVEIYDGEREALYSRKAKGRTASVDC